MQPLYSGIRFFFLKSLRKSPPAWWPRLWGSVSQHKGARALYVSDFYALTPLSHSDYDWIGFELHRADLGRGILQIFRRVHSSLPSSEFPVFGLERSARYNVSCWDGMGLGADAMVLLSLYLDYPWIP